MVLLAAARGNARKALNYLYTSLLDNDIMGAGMSNGDSTTSVKSNKKSKRSVVDKNRLDDIYHEIREKIIHDVYYPGQKLSENALAGQYSLSRTPIREILQRLSNEGLVVIKPKSGTYVQHQTSKDYVDLLQVRSYLESLAYRLAIERATDKDIQAAAAIKAKMDKVVESIPVDKRRFGELHIQFHEKIVDMSGNAVLITSYKRLHLRASHMFRETMDMDGIHNTQDEHQTILDNLQARDPKGEQYMEYHLWRRLRYLVLAGNPAD